MRNIASHGTYAHVDRGDLSIGVMRLAAGDPVKRRGTLVLNLVGPDDDGLSTALQLFQVLERSDPNDTLGAMNLCLIAEYNMIGFSPRGTGISRRVHCDTNEQLYFGDINIAGAKPENLAKFDFNGKRTAEACRKNLLIPYINSNATAQDIDMLRDILGDEQHNFLCYSYGTWLRARYASMFPDRVDRMVLIGLMDITKPIETTVFRTTLARQHVLARHLAGAGYRRGNAESYLLGINAAKGLQDFIDTASKPVDRIAAMSAFEVKKFVPGDFTHDRMARAVAKRFYLAFANALDETDARGQSVLLDSATAVY